MINVIFEEELGDPEDDINENHEIKTEARVSSVPHPELNITTTAVHPNIVVYNRVPKCGSQTLSMLINQLGRKNDFLSKAVFEANEKPERSEADQRAFMKELSDLAYSKQKRVLYTRHQYFIDFEELNWNDGDRPVYINLIRDPIDRFKSFYYFSRYGNKRAQDAGRTKNQVPAHLMDESIDDCITRRRRECTEPIWHTVPYLCGNDKVCLKKFEKTIQITKERIDSKYLVVGVLEQLKGTLGVLEKLLPDFFAGAVNQLDLIKNDTYTVKKKDLSDAARDYLAEQTTLKLEYDLYYHIRTRLLEQMRRLDISPEPIL